MRQTLRLLLAVFSVLSVVSLPLAAPPPDIPGDEITDEYVRRLMPADSIRAHAPEASPASATWLDEAMKSWDAPDLSTQLAADKVFIPMGKGALFVPRLTEPELEPDIEILDTAGVTMAHGKPGVSFSLLPGRYFVMMGSGAHKQMVVREAVVEEGRVSPVVPDWSGLVVDVVNEDNTPIRGDYELVRIDELELFGRGTGADPSLGEQPRTWVLKPGLYKLLGVGESYNTLRNFITVRLLPGALARILLVMDNETDMKIMGGGVVQVGLPGRSKRAWNWGLDLGGSLLFNATIDRRQTVEEDVRANTSTLEMLANGWVRYTKGRRDWYTSLRLDEGFTVTDFQFDRIDVVTDDLRLRSLGVWRLLKWLGPYARAEMESDIFPKLVRRDEGENQFLIVPSDTSRPVTTSADASYTIEPSFSPFTIQVGLGANADLVDARVLQARFRAGFGYSFRSIRDKYVPIESSAVDTLLLDSLQRTLLGESRALRDEGSAATHEAGPEAALLANLRLGKFATASAEVRWFAPVAPEERFARPDISLEAVLSWRIVRSVSLEYEYTYALEQPEDDNLKVDLQRHSVRIRVSLRTK